MSKTLVIVESPTKAKTISKFLGPQYIVESSFGHVRDLPKSKMGVDIEGGTFEPQYIVSKDRSAQVKKLKDLAKKTDKIIFATDEDREGEAISWHLAAILDVDPAKADRIVFHEITKSALEEAIKNPRHIDQKLVDAQQARRVLDRLVGYELSPLLWKKVARGLSAGRVQSVAMRLVVEREREIQNFKSEEYWTIEGTFLTKENAKIVANLFSIDNKKLDKFDVNTEEKAKTIVKKLEGKEFSITNIEKKETKKTPPPPFTTSTLQQKANTVYGFSSKQTMRLAQQLYEGIKLGSQGHLGLITYMRTDSVNLSEKFIGEAKSYIHGAYGEKYDLSKPRFYAQKSKNAQEAHEAIRPSDPARTPESLKEHLDSQQLKLYTLIWKRALATQMAEARMNKMSLDITGEKHIFRANGQTILFDGWLKLYPTLTKEELLPETTLNEPLHCENIKPDQHFTEPPARYSDATLVKALEEHGVGRPSTYAPTLATIEARNYVERVDKKLKPTDIAFVVNDLLVEHFNNIVDFEFTAKMEENLDEIAEGKKDWKPIIATFYHPFHETIMQKKDEITKETATQARELGNDPKTGEPIFVKIGRFGPYVQKGKAEGEEKPKFASLKKEQTADTITLEEALVLLQLPRIFTNEDGQEIEVNIGRFGPYAKMNGKFHSIKEGDPYTITKEQVLAIIKEAGERDAKKTIQDFPSEGIQILNGRYGPYITDGKKNIKIPKGTEPEKITVEECKELLEGKKAPTTKKKTTKKAS